MSDGRPSSPPSAAELCRQAVQLAHNEKEAFLSRACQANPALREEVEALLKTHLHDSFLESVAQRTTEVRPIALLEESGSVIGRYKLLEKVGEGGFGAVWMAEQKEPVKRRVALKILKLGMDTKQVVARFEAERQALAMMDHANIAKVLDAGATEAGRPYFAMELVRGIQITQYCDQKKLNPEERLRLFIKVCQAIQHAHQKGIIHRDIKPSNILVTLHDGTPVPKVIDFGIAKATQGDLTDKTVFTQFQQFIGTPAYMSPEQAEMSGLDIDTRADVYSLGVLLYELLTGKTPFDGKALVASGLDEMRRTIREVEPARPSTRLATLEEQERTTTAQRRGMDGARLVGHLKGDLDWIAMKCLEKDRTRRYDTANDLAADIERYLTDEPVLARPPSQWYRVQKTIRRNRGAAVAAAAVVLVLVLGVMGSTWQAVRATKAEREQGRLLVESKKAQMSESRAREEEAKVRKQVQALSYASDMNLAQQAIEANNPERALLLLARHRPTRLGGMGGTNGAGDGDLAGWEWRHLWEQCRSDESSMLLPAASGFSALAVSPESKWLAVCAGDGRTNLWVWNVEAHQKILGIPDTDGIVELAFSPSGSVLAVVDTLGITLTNHFRLRCIDISTGTLIHQAETGSLCARVWFSPDGGSVYCATAYPRCEVVSWRLADGRETTVCRVPGLPKPNFTRGSIFDVDPERQIAVYGSYEGSIHVVDLAAARELWQAKVSYEEGIPSVVALSPDASRVVVASFENPDIQVWSMTDKQRIGWLKGHRNYVQGLAFLGDGSRLASSGGDKTIRIWDFQSLSPIGRPASGAVRIAGLSRFSTNSLVSGGGGKIHLWEPVSMQRPKAHFTFPARLVGWRFLPDGESVVTCTPQGRIERWRPPYLKPESLVLNLATNTSGAVFSPDARWVAIRLPVGFLIVDSVHHTSSFHPQRHPEENDPAGLPVQLYLPFAAAEGTRLVLRPDFEGDLIGFDLSGRVPKEDSKWRLPPECYVLTLSPGGRVCTSFGHSGQVVQRDFITGTLQSNFMLSGDVNCAVFSDDATMAATSPHGVEIKLYSLPGWKELGSLSGFQSYVDSVAFSPDGTRLASGSSLDQSIRIWDPHSQDESLLTLKTADPRFRLTRFSPDGRMLGAMSANGTLHVWKAPSWEEIATAEMAAAGQGN